jgi:hypothetical protein
MTIQEVTGENKMGVCGGGGGATKAAAEEQRKIEAIESFLFILVRRLIYLSIVVAEAAAEEQRKIEAAKRNGKIEVRYNHYKVPPLPALPYLTLSFPPPFFPVFFCSSRRCEWESEGSGSSSVFFFFSRSNWTLRRNQEVGLSVTSVMFNLPPLFPFLIGDQCRVQFCFLILPPPLLEEQMDNVDGDIKNQEVGSSLSSAFFIFFHKKN